MGTYWGLFFLIKDIIAGALLGAFIAISVHHSDIVGARKMVSLFYFSFL